LESIARSLGDQLHALHLCFNQIDNIPPTIPFTTLELLNLENNQISEWGHWAEYLAPLQLKKLILSGNPIKTLLHSARLDSLQALSINDMQIDNWDSIDCLDQFPNLVELRLQGIPLFADIPSRIQRYFTIGRLHKLVMLNGSSISPREREDAEKYYLNNCYEISINQSVEQKEEFKRAHPRFEALLKQYGTPLLSGSNTEHHTLASAMITITLCQDFDPVTTKTVPSSITVGNLKVLINHLLKIRGSDQVLSFKRDLSDLAASELDDDTRSLSYYGVMDKSFIIVKKQN